MPYKTLKVTQASVQVAHNKGNSAANDPSLKVTQAAAQVAHTGGGGIPTGLCLTQAVVQVAHNKGNSQAHDPSLKITHVAVQIAYTETYPNVTLTGYTPRLLVDILFPTSGIARFTTEDTYVEEI